MSKSAKARAHTNIALIKYWGKKDTELILPMNNSLSLTLDHFYTDTSVNFDANLIEDSFILNGKKRCNNKIHTFLNIVRQMSGITEFAQVNSVNHVPTTAGLASSASAFAALAAAASKASGLNLSKKDLSRLARRGSGSASRSIYGGFVEWQSGTNDLDSYAIPFVENVDWDIKMLAVVVNSAPKKITSRVGMQTVVETSPFYSAWIEEANRSIPIMKDAILKRDFTTMGELAEENAMKMHALNLSAHPHFNYFSTDSIRVMNLVEELRSLGIECYYTLDAGPNVKILCKGNDVEIIKDFLTNNLPKADIFVSSAGPGVQYLD